MGRGEREKGKEFRGHIRELIGKGKKEQCKGDPKVIGGGREPMERVRKRSKNGEDGSLKWRRWCIRG